MKSRLKCRDDGWSCTCGTHISESVDKRTGGEPVEKLHCTNARVEKLSAELNRGRERNNIKECQRAAMLYHFELFELLMFIG